MAAHLPGAQTERRGGAGPAGGLLGGKGPAGRFGSAWTVCKTVLLFAVLRSHQFPRLRAEVPDGLLSFTPWTNTPPAVDLLVRLVVPASGLGLVMLPFFLGQAFLSGELGMSQGENDPLTGVARASRFPLARLLQGFDAGLPVAGAVVNPAQELPRPLGVWGDFDGLLGQAHRTARIATCRLRVRGQGPGQAAQRPGQ